MGGANSGRKPKKQVGIPTVTAKVEDKPKNINVYGCGACQKEFGEKYPLCPYCGASLTWKS